MVQLCAAVFALVFSLFRNQLTTMDNEDKRAIAALNEHVQARGGGLVPVFKSSASSNLAANEVRPYTLTVGEEVYGPMHGTSIKEVKRLLAVEYLSRNVPEINILELKDSAENSPWANILNSEGGLNYRHVLHEVCVRRPDIPQCASYSAVKHTLEGPKRRYHYRCNVTVTINGEKVCAIAEGDTNQVARDAAAKVIVNRLYPGIAAVDGITKILSVLEQEKPSKGSLKRNAMKKKRKSAEMSGSSEMASEADEARTMATMSAPGGDDIDEGGAHISFLSDELVQEVLLKRAKAAAAEDEPGEVKE
jgi:hypothetical protein